MPNVRCSVANCTHWGQGNFCQASEILVQTEPYAYAMQTDGEQIMSSVLNGEITSVAEHSAETCCQTFKPR